MFKRVISSIVLIVFLIGIFVAANPLSITVASAEEYRGGFNLAPTVSDATGVKPESKYILKAQQATNSDNIRKLLSIDNEPAPQITQQNARTFLITPARAFEQNKLYTFRLKTAGSDITWTFQTSAVFRILGAFPADKTTNVPVNSGIEIYFSHDEYEDVDKYFEISPVTAGSFERHKKAVVFVPKDMKEGTLYTVTVKKGLKLKGTDYSLKEDYVFRFETEEKSSGAEQNNYPGYFSYNKQLNEFRPGEKPSIPVNYYINRDKIKSGSIKVKTTVYAYNGIDSFIEALQNKSSVPPWAYLSYSGNFISSNGLNKSLEFEQEFGTKSGIQQFINLPASLPAGYYLLDSSWENIRFQTFIEVTDIGMYVTRSNNKTLIWLNDLSLKKPASSATLTLAGDGSSYISDSRGIALFDTPAAFKSKEEENIDESKKYFKITAEDGKMAVLDYNSYIYRYYGNYGTSQYWNYVQMDRSLFKPDDTVNFWGFIKNRYENEKIGTLTVEISRGSRYYYRAKGLVSDFYYPGSDQPLVSEAVNVENNSFSSSISLPSIDPGGYQLVVKKGEDIISSTYLTVENYVKPPYKIDIAKSREAVFPGEQVDFNVKASFFEGTGVPNLQVDYTMQSSFGGSVPSGTKTTDANGSIALGYTPSAGSGAQGENYAGLYVRASLPEIGEISENSGVRVFINDINVSISTDIKKDKKIINAAVNEIVLDRLNDGTAKDSGDYLGSPVAGKTLQGTLYKNTWVKIENGQYYDFINKVVQKNYRYETRTEAVRSFSMTTDAQGKASFDAALPDPEDGWYSAKMYCTDNSGRSMNFEYIYLGKYYENYNSSYEDSRYYLDGGKEAYKAGEAVDLTFKKGKTTLPALDSLSCDSFLYIKSQNGIRDYSLAKSPRYSFKLTEKDIPNTYVTGVYFNGITYVESESFNCIFDNKEKNLVISAQLDKSSYKPGDEVVVKIDAKNNSGVPQKAIINASMVDEALFKLQDQEVDTLASLYSGVPSGISYSYQSHVNSGMDNSGGMGSMDTVENQSAALNDKGSRNLMKAKSAKSGEGASEKAREDFRDTAFFNTLVLDDKGTGEMRFRLPDNITSWRITLSGVTIDLLGGSNKVSLPVSLPFFINYTMNSTYLSGDVPVLGVNAYGTGLSEEDMINFEVSSPSNPDLSIKAQGKAFERVNIPLWKLAEGTYDIIIKASTAKGATDTVKHKIAVLGSYHQTDTAAYAKLSKDAVLKGGSTGNTRLVFTDDSKGAFLPVLTGMLYPAGNRIDQKLSSKAAYELIKKHFKDEEITYDQSFKASDYQTEDGGIAILPYGDSDLDLSARLAPFIKDEVNAPKLKDYFYGVLYGDSPGLKGNALYGLSVLGEPVLLELDNAAKVENSSIKDIIYIALAYCELGEVPKAEKLFSEKLQNILEEYRPYYRINSGIDKDDILECTSLASILASKLNRPEKKGLYDYCLVNGTKDILINLEKLSYIAGEIDKTSENTAKFSYTLFGKKYTRTLTNGGVFTLNIPSKKLTDLKITEVSGNVSVVSVYKEQAVQPGKLDPNISVSRKYYKYGDTASPSTSFKENDIIKVVLDWDIGQKAIEGGYQISDFLPSGLKPIDISYTLGMLSDRHGCYGSIDGQRVSFYVYSEWDTKTYKPELYYYARVVSPGTYKADSPIIQGIASRDSINLGKAEAITIK